jgi:predicted DNA-binding protein (MmcQ/YjbR family)
MGGFQRAREFALSLPGTSEEPHFDMSSFRVKGKIFATVPAALTQWAAARSSGPGGS